MPLLWRSAFEVQVDFVVLDGQRHVQGERLQVAVGGDGVVGFAVGEFADGSPQGPFTAAQDFGRQGIHVGYGVVVQKLPDALDADAVCANDGMQIAQNHVGHPAVGGNELLNHGNNLALRIELVGHDPGAFHEHVLGFQVAKVPSDIRHMRHGAQKGHQPALVEHGRNKVVVRQVGAADPGIVGGQHIPFPERVRRKALQHGLGGARQHRAELGRTPLRLGQAGTFGIHEGAAEVVAFAHNGRKRRADHRVVDFVHDVDQSLPLDFQSDGIERHVRDWSFMVWVGTVGLTCAVVSVAQSAIRCSPRICMQPRILGEPSHRPSYCSPGQRTRSAGWLCLLRRRAFVGIHYSGGPAVKGQRGGCAAEGCYFLRGRGGSNATRRGNSNRVNSTGSNPTVSKFAYAVRPVNSALTRHSSDARRWSSTADDGGDCRRFTK